MSRGIYGNQQKIYCTVDDFWNLYVPGNPPASRDSQQYCLQQVF